MKIMKPISSTALLTGCFILCIADSGIGKTGDGPPNTPVYSVKDTLHGTVVTDPYRWLENWDDVEVQSWSESQNKYAREFLDHISFIKPLYQRISHIMKASSSSYYDMSWQNGKLFSQKYQPPLNQPLLIYMKSAYEPESEKIIVNPNILDSENSTSMDWYVPSPDGKLVAVSLSFQGSEKGDLYIFETESGRQTDIVIENVNGGTAGGDMAWISDGSGFYYTRYPGEGERSAEDMAFYQQVWYHQLGTSIDHDKYIIGKAFPRIAEIRIETDYETNTVLLTLQYGDSGRFSFFIIRADGSWKKISDFDDGIVQAVCGHNGTLFLISRKGAPRGEVLKLSLSNPSLDQAKTLIHECDDTIISGFEDRAHFLATQTTLYITYQLGGPSEIRAFDYNGKRSAAPKSLPVSSIDEIVPLDNDDILFCNSSYISPRHWLHFRAETENTGQTALKTESPVDFSDSEVIREYAVSKDGTNIPVNIVIKKGLKKDGSHPLLLYGYGGFDVSITPSFSAVRRVWIEQGGICAYANIRGGGEFGEKWHDEGTLLKKQNCFDDFAAVMQYLIDSGYTSVERLAIYGGSNGGLLMGAILTQHPDMFRTTVSFVGIYDMLRNELTPNGQFNVPEYGSVKNVDQFKAMFAYSPYHHVQSHTPYPSVLFMTGANDPRVDPMHSRKMTAALQAATTSDNPILLRTSSKTGHGIGSPLDERILQTADMYAFIFKTLNIDYHAIE
jgi:prolyl oligopeptidase